MFIILVYFINKPARVLVPIVITAETRWHIYKLNLAVIRLLFDDVLSRSGSEDITEI